MHKLAREVRFSINPFLPQEPGFNGYCSKPCGQGLAIFLALWVELTGQAHPDTGFVVNVVEIDKAVRKYAVPLLAEKITEDFKKSKHIGLDQIGELLTKVWKSLADKFPPSALSSVGLQLNPNRKMSIDSESGDMLYYSEKFEFAASHTLWNDKFSEEQNFDIFGKCANPTGHGHNYVVEVIVKRAAEDQPFMTGQFERIVDDELINVLDHKNLNSDIPRFSTTIPTVENIAQFAWDRLEGKFKNCDLDSITVWETAKTYCKYSR